MIKIFIESIKFSHKTGVTKHATNTLARKSQIQDTDVTDDTDVILYISVFPDSMVLSSKGLH